MEQTEQKISMEVLKEAIFKNISVFGWDMCKVETEYNYFVMRLKANQQAAAVPAKVAAKEFVELFGMGLSFNEKANEIYVYPRKGGGVAEPTPFGKAKLKIMLGVITGYEMPELVYESEIDSVLVSMGNVVQHHKKLKRDPKDTVIGGYVRIWLPNRSEPIAPFFDLNQINEWKAKSSNPKMYEQKGMLQSKILAHALKRIGGTAVSFAAQPLSTPVAPVIPSFALPEMAEFDEESGEVYEAPMPAPTPTSPAPATEQDTPF